MKEKYWIAIYLAVIVGLWLTAWFTVDAFDELLFNPVTVASMASLLLPLLVVATVIERTVEVYVNTAREPEKAELERKAKAAKTAMEEADAADKPGLRTTYQEDNTALVTYRGVTRRKAFLTSLALGTVVSIVGVRVLYPLVNFDHAIEGSQGRGFDFLDVMLTGALLSGGAEPIHKIMTLITGTLDEWQGNG